MSRPHRTPTRYPNGEIDHLQVELLILLHAAPHGRRARDLTVGGRTVQGMAAMLRELDRLGLAWANTPGRSSDGVMTWQITQYGRAMLARRVFGAWDL